MTDLIGQVCRQGGVEVDALTGIGFAKHSPKGPRAPEIESTFEPAKIAVRIASGYSAS